LRGSNFQTAFKQLKFMQSQQHLGKEIKKFGTQNPES